LSAIWQAFAYTTDDAQEGPRAFVEKRPSPMAGPVSRTMRLFRTLMFAPGSRPDLLSKAQQGQADALIFDLEDSVPHQSKQEARANILQVLQQGLSKPVFLRVNHPRAGDCQADLELLAKCLPAQVQGLILPKAESPGDLEQVGQWLADIESKVRTDPRTLTHPSFGRDLPGIAQYLRFGTLLWAYLWDVAGQCRAGLISWLT